MNMHHSWPSGVQFVTALVIAGALLSGCSGEPEPGVSTKTSAGEATPTTVLRLTAADVVTVRSGGVQPVISVTGTLQPLVISTVNARVPAVVDAVLVREGQSVNQGHPLVRQNTDDLHAQLRQAEAALAAAQVELQLTEALEKKKAELYEKKYLSEIDYAAAQGETAVRRSTVNVQEASVAIARKAAADTVLRAPIKGVVAKRHVDPGVQVMPGQPLVTMVDLSELELEAAVPARDVPKIRIGGEVRFTVDGFGEREFTGSIVRINPVADEARNVRIYARVANADHTLRGGMFAKGKIRLPGTGGEGALQLPLAALRQDGAQHWVWVVRDNRLQRVDIALQARDEGTSVAQVTGELKPDEAVVMTDIGAASAGTAVTIDTP
ncbi:MAG: efflux RND transporter periplasmic adaptor subunit [Gammaproteobacteria bacterium]